VLAVTGWAERLAYLPTRGTPPPPAGVEEFWFERPGGERLHGWWMPADAPASRGAILAVHGNAGNVSVHHPFVEALPAAGFAVLLFDYRGYGKSDPGRLDRWALREDTEAALDALLGRPDVDPERVGLYAQSIGAAFGLDVMARRGEVRAAVVVSGFSSWRGETASLLAQGREPGPIARGLARLLMPAGLDPIDALARIERRPVLLIHGTADEIVAFHHAERLLAAGGDNVRLRVVEGGDHNSLRWLDETLDREIAEFFASALAAGGDRDDEPA
jgi:hypothetical protein